MRRAPRARPAVIAAWRRRSSRARRAPPPSRSRRPGDQPRARARALRSSSSVSSNGFWMKSNAPALIASTAPSTLPYAVINTTAAARVPRSRRRAAPPPRPRRAAADRSPRRRTARHRDREPFPARAPPLASSSTRSSAPASARTIARRSVACPRPPAPAPRRVARCSWRDACERHLERKGAAAAGRAPRPRRSPPWRDDRLLHPGEADARPPVARVVKNGKKMRSRKRGRDARAGVPCPRRPPRDPGGAGTGPRGESAHAVVGALPRETRCRERSRGALRAIACTAFGERDSLEHRAQELAKSACSPSRAGASRSARSISPRKASAPAPRRRERGPSTASARSSGARCAAPLLHPRSRGTPSTVARERVRTSAESSSTSASAEGSPSIRPPHEPGEQLEPASGFRISCASPAAICRARRDARCSRSRSSARSIGGRSRNR